MKKFGQSSIWDALLNIMPELAPRLRSSTEYVDPIAANSLYDMWRTGCSKNGKNFKKPSTVAKDEIDRMKSAGLVKVIGNEINITDKGAKVIRVMILGDDRSVFEDNGIAIDYNRALSNMRPTKTAKQNKAASSDGWWERFKK